MAAAAAVPVEGVASARELERWAREKINLGAGGRRTRI